MKTVQVKGIILFLASYLLLYVLYATLDFLPKWDAYGSSILRGQPLSGYLFVDPLFLFIPMIGFSLMWVVLQWYLRRFKDEGVLSIPFALGFVLVSYAAFFMALLGYYWNNAYLSALQQGNPNPSVSSFGFTWQFALENFVDLLLQSPFFVFVLSGLLGWISFWLVHRVWGESLTHLSNPS